MKHLSSTQTSAWKRISVILSLFLATLILFSFKYSDKAIDALWQQLGITQQQGTERIKSSFLNNYFDSRGVSKIKNLAAGDRTAMAKDILSYSKEYLNSAAFIKEYEELRKNAKPTKPEINTQTKEDIRKEKITEAEKNIKETEELIKKSNADMKAIFESVLETHKSTLQEYKDPNSTMLDLIYQGELNKAKDDSSNYEMSMQNWRKNYPEDYKLFIKTRLQHYLEVANTVDFAAQTMEKSGKQRFVNPVYETKNNEWKMIYRAGKEVYNSTKPFAEQWLQEISNK